MGSCYRVSIIVEFCNRSDVVFVMNCIVYYNDFFCFEEGFWIFRGSDGNVS